MGSQSRNFLQWFPVIGTLARQAENFQSHLILERKETYLAEELLAERKIDEALVDLKTEEKLISTFD